MSFKILLSVLMMLIVYTANADDTLILASPNHNFNVNIYHRPDGQIKYAVYYKSRLCIQPSALAMKLKTPDVLLNKFDLVKSDQSQFDETWKPVWGEVSSI